MPDRIPSELLAKEFFESIPGFLKELINDEMPVWEALKKLKAFISASIKREIKIDIPQGVYLSGNDISIGEGTKIEPGVMIKSPAIIGKNVDLRQGAYIRGDVIICDNCVVGHSSELKHTIMLDGAHAPHFNYLGDSILGKKVNLGAGTILSNFKMTTEKNIKIRFKDTVIDTGLRKFGAMLGDNSETGCNSVLNPGTIVGMNSLIYPLSLVRGYIPPNTIYKVRQQFSNLTRNS